MNRRDESLKETAERLMGKKQKKSTYPQNISIHEVLEK